MADREPPSEQQPSDLGARSGLADLADLPRRPIEEVRALRAEGQALEDRISYLRRLIQGRLDIVHAELERRRRGEPPADLAELVAALPETLGDHITSPGFGRLPQTLNPADVNPDLTADLDAILDAGGIGALPARSDQELADLERRLGALERTVSDRRQALFERLDVLSGELTRRYRTGEASVESLLK